MLQGIKNCPIQHLCLACSCPYMSLTVFSPPALTPTSRTTTLVACFPIFQAPLSPSTTPPPPNSSLFIYLAQRVDQGAPKNSDPWYVLREGWQQGGLCHFWDPSFLLLLLSLSTRRCWSSWLYKMVNELYTFLVYSERWDPFGVTTIWLWKKINEKPGIIFFFLSFSVVCH